MSTPTPLEGYSSDTTNLRIVRWREKYLNSKEAKWMTAGQGNMRFRATEIQGLHHEEYPYLKRRSFLSAVHE